MNEKKYKQKNKQDEESIDRLNKQLEKARFLGKCEEDPFINSNLSYNELDREYLLKFAKLLNHLLNPYL